MTSRVDAHVKVLSDRVIRRAKRRGIDALVYAPHFTRWPTIRERAAAASDDDLLVVPGRELFTGHWRGRQHVLALDLERPVPDFLTLSGTMAELDRQGAVVLVPHPGFLTISLGRAEIGEYRDQIDAVEVYNPKHLPRDNRRGQSLAREFDLPAFGSSYAHLAGTIGEVWTAVDRPIGDAAALHRLFREGADRRVEHRSGPEHTLRRALELGHVGYENTWKKFDRVYLSGTAATHPDHVAYGGRYDDVSVY